MQYNFDTMIVLLVNTDQSDALSIFKEKLTQFIVWMLTTVPSLHWWRTGVPNFIQALLSRQACLFLLALCR